MNNIGVFVANTGGLPPAHTAVVDYFFNTAEPIDPEDASSYKYTLDTNIIGGGTITVNPTKLSYDFNEVVTVTAVPDPGWVFNNWTGDLSGGTLSKTITMDSNRAITATFIEDTIATHNLTINKVGSGNVIVTPDKASYMVDEVVNVTAVPALGWTFANWSGDNNSAASSIQITMDSDKSLTAHFDALTFTINTAVSGQGNVTVSPVKSSYTYGEVITLTAEADSGWEFDSWSGASVFGGNNPKQIVVTGNTSITANFKELTFTVTTAVNGQGNVMVSPVKSSYTYGEIVTLTAEADSGWEFDSWSGPGASGSDNPKQIVVTGDISVTANFQEIEDYFIFLPMVIKP